jgi:cis-3-alkyl-4-acyloxetan-2-one decarboxylase
VAVDWRSQYPFESRWYAPQGLRYHYVDEGVGDRPVVAVHGNPTWSFYWRRLISGMADRTRVLAVDHIGCGLSDKPAHYDYTLTRHRDNLVAWIQSLDLQRITLVVHDWGGAIGLAAALEVPSRIERLVLLNTGAFPPPYLPWRIAACRLPLLGTLAVRGLNAFARAAVSMAVARQRRLPPIAAAGLLAPYDRWASRVAIDRFVRDIPTRRTHPTYAVLETLEQRLPELADRRALMIWGMRDWCFRPECLERFQQVWPAAETLRLADVGHYVMEDAPEETVEAIAAFHGRGSGG